MNRLLLVIVILIVAGAVLLSTLGSDAAQKMQSGFLGIIAPFVKTGSAVQKQIGEVGSGLKNLDQLEAEYNRLTTENRELRTENQLLRDIEAENNKLREALEYRKRSVFKLLPARVISRDGSTWWSTIKINRGFEDGVETDEPVLTDAGLVGKTTTVAKNESIVLLITDETCKVAGKVEGSREQGILSGIRVQQSDTPGLLQMDFLSKQANLQPGQKVYSAGVSNGVFPSGYPSGREKFPGARTRWQGHRRTRRGYFDGRRCLRNRRSQMKDILGGISFALCIFLALIVQEFIPPMHILLGAHVLLVPTLFCLAAIAYSPWTMLGLAVFTGFILDLMNVHIVAGRVEIALGWSIVYFVLLGLLCHGFQPAFLRVAGGFTPASPSRPHRFTWPCSTS